MATQQSQSQREAQATAALIALYVLAEQTLLGGVAHILAQPATDHFAQLGQVAAVKRLAVTVSTQLAAQSPALIREVIAAASAGGVNQAVAQVAAIPGERPVVLASTNERRPTVAATKGFSGAPPRRPLIPNVGGSDGFDFAMAHGQRAAQAIAADLTSELDDVRYRITRLDEDIYKIIGPMGAVVQVNRVDATTVDAQHAAYRDFINQGVTGFTDKSGRDWSLSAYTEMAVRTASNRAYNSSHIAIIQATGHNLVTVSSDGHPCPKCFPWQGVVCCIVADGIHPTMADAIAAGLMHPNCRHTWIVVVPGLTPALHPQEWTPEHQVAYNTTQRQRGYELQIRKAKKQLEYAQDADQKADAQKIIVRNRAHIRAIVKSGVALRQSRREQPDLTLSR